MNSVLHRQTKVHQTLPESLYSVYLRVKWSVTHTTLYPFPSFFVEGSARPDGGVPQKVQRRLTRVRSAAEEHLATRPEQQQSSVRDYAHLGLTATMGTRSA